MVYAIRKGILFYGERPVRQIASPNHSGAFRRPPAILVMHYTAGASATGSANWLADPAASASAHAVIARSGEVIQCVSLDNRAWHAGRSAWKGLEGLNSHSIGIELANWGPLVRHPSGTGWANPAGARVDAIEAAHKHGGSVRGWEVYPEAQIAAAQEVARAVAAYLPIAEIVGHEDIAPGRKTDPGPAFAMDTFRAAVLDGAHRAAPRTATVMPAALNVRSGPGLAFPVIASLARGSTVTPGEVHRDWIAIGPSRWVYGQYLA
ncbi:N-acetylmuramoyl-L-alanine amidase [Novosphingobium sp. 1949]|uniref:N-acetylmuramoyl-L-alanine amidase n=1 Tax=Novosphingobium organovorum TaxID=2930092 RepID=A0ABT0BBP5_9SPHN|nr:N-acetylmuramoyl-L-alanine amidase [Novosphingobium organovorum]MCJ2182480.1 N-acetylmuramoyl-L-alanine amidase [Novosphingobium organovorum]